MLIGITGQIGSGKTTAAGELKRMGAAIIDADRIGHEVVENNRKLRNQLASSFGKHVLTNRGHLNRSKLAEIAFSTPTNKKLLDKLVHPFLLKELHRQIKRFSRTHKVVVIDAALLLDWNFDKVVDRVLVIHCGLEKRLKRLRQKGINVTDVRARQRIQMPFSEYKRRADRVILNTSSKKELQRKVREWARPFFN